MADRLSRRRNQRVSYCDACSVLCSVPISSFSDLILVYFISRQSPNVILFKEMKIPIQRKFESEPEIFLLSILTFQPMQLQSSETVSIGNQGERLSKVSLPSTSSSVFSALPFCSGPHSPTDQQSKNDFKMKEEVDF